jgi:hypothetical protein
MMEARVYEWRQSAEKRPSQPGPVVTVSRDGVTLILTCLLSGCRRLLPNSDWALSNS